MIKYAIPVKMDSKGRITIPKHILDELQWKPRELEVIVVYNDCDKKQITVKEND